MTVPGDGKEKKNGRWTAHEKELFIDGKLRYYLTQRSISNMTIILNFIFIFTNQINSFFEYLY